MGNSIAAKIFLVVSGLIGIVIGGALLFFPVAFHASSGISLGDNVNLLSETRAPGGTLVAAGALIALGAFNPRTAPTSFLISSLFYLSYGVSRLYSLFVDGIPHSSLVVAMGCEIAIGLLSLFVLLKANKHRPVSGRFGYFGS